MPAAELVYIDASAFVKLVLVEAETAALIEVLEGVLSLVASQVLEVEVMRATRRGGGDVALARAQLDVVWLMPLSEGIRRRASDLTPDSVRSLDAIHIATALSLGERLGGLCTYDQRMSDAGRDAGLDVFAPA